MGGCFVIFLKSIKGIFLQKKGLGGGLPNSKTTWVLFKVEGVGGGERHDFRKPIICAIKKVIGNYSDIR